MLTNRNSESISRFRSFIGVLVTSISAITFLLGLLGLCLNWIGMGLYLFGGDYSGWLIMGTAVRFYGVETFLGSLYAFVLGFLGIAFGEWLQGKKSRVSYGRNLYKKRVKAAKKIKIISIFFGLTSLIYISIRVYNSTIPWDLVQFWKLISWWPRMFVIVVINPHLWLKLKSIIYLALIIYAGSIVSSIILGKKSNRIPIIPFVITLLFPYALILFGLNSRFLKDGS